MNNKLVAEIYNPAVPNLGDSSNAPQTIGKFISGFIMILLIGATVWAFFQLLLGGFNWISSGGDKGKLEAAQQKMMHAIIGLIIVFASWAIFIVLLNFLGMSEGVTGVIKFSLPTL